MSFFRDPAETAEHPLITAFLELLNGLGRGCMAMAEYLFWSPLVEETPNLIVMRWVPERRDFVYRLHGRTVASDYGVDLTGKYVVDGNQGAGGELNSGFIGAHRECVETGKLIYLNGNLDWRDWGSRKWNQVITPLGRTDGFLKTLTHVAFDSLRARRGIAISFERPGRGHRPCAGLSRWARLLNRDSPFNVHFDSPSQPDPMEPA